MENNVITIGSASIETTVANSIIHNPAVLAVFGNMSLMKASGFKGETYEDAVRQRFMTALQNDAQFNESCGFTAAQLYNGNLVKFDYTLDSLGQTPEWSKFVTDNAKAIAAGVTMQETVRKVYVTRISACNEINQRVFAEVLESVEAADFVDAILEREFADGAGDAIDNPLPQAQAIELEIVNEDQVTIVDDVAEELAVKETVESIDKAPADADSLSSEETFEKTAVIEPVEEIAPQVETIEPVEKVKEVELSNDDLITTPIAVPEVPQVEEVPTPQVEVFEPIVAPTPEVEAPITAEMFQEKLGHIAVAKTFEPTAEILNHAAKVQAKAAAKAAKIQAIERYQKAPQNKRPVFTHTREGLEFVPKHAVGQTLPCFPLGALYISARSEAIREANFIKSGTKKAFVNNAGKMSIGSMATIFNGELRGVQRHMSSFQEGFEFRMALCEVKIGGNTEFVSVPYILLCKVIDKAHNGFHASISPKAENFEGVRPTICHPFNNVKKRELINDKNMFYMGTYRSSENVTVDVFYDITAPVHTFQNF